MMNNGQFKNVYIFFIKIDNNQTKFQNLFGVVNLGKTFFYI